MDHPAQVENEQAFLRMQEGPNPNPNPNPAPNPNPSPTPNPSPSPSPNPNPNQEGAAGQASRAANEKFFDARLNKDSSRTGVPPELFSEPPGRLRGTVVYAPEEAVAGRNTAARHAKSLEGAAGVTRQQFRGGAEHLAYDGSLRGGTEHGKAAAHVERPRNDMRSADMAAALNPAMEAAAVTPLATAALAPIEGRPQRSNSNPNRNRNPNPNPDHNFPTLPLTQTLALTLTLTLARPPGAARAHGGQGVPREERQGGHVPRGGRGHRVRAGGLRQGDGREGDDGAARDPNPNPNPNSNPDPNPNPNPSPNQELLAGDGYYSRSDPRQLARLDGSAPKRGIYDQAPGADGGPATQLSQAQKNSRLANRDTVGADNMLQPESEGGAATQGGYPSP